MSNSENFDVGKKTELKGKPLYKNKFIIAFSVFLFLCLIGISVYFSPKIIEHIAIEQEIKKNPGNYNFKYYILQREYEEQIEKKKEIEYSHLTILIDAEQLLKKHKYSQNQASQEYTKVARQLIDLYNSLDMGTYSDLNTINRTFNNLFLSEKEFDKDIYLLILNSVIINIKKDNQLQYYASLKNEAFKTCQNYIKKTYGDKAITLKPTYLNLNEVEFIGSEYNQKEQETSFYKIDSFEYQNFDKNLDSKMKKFMNNEKKQFDLLRSQSKALYKSKKNKNINNLKTKFVNNYEGLLTKWTSNVLEEHEKLYSKQFLIKSSFKSNDFYGKKGEIEYICKMKLDERGNKPVWIFQVLFPSVGISSSPNLNINFINNNYSN